MQKVLINGQWRDASSSSSFQAHNPATCEALPDEYPVSDWNDCDDALAAAESAAAAMASLPATAVLISLTGMLRESNSIPKRSSALPTWKQRCPVLPAWQTLNCLGPRGSCEQPPLPRGRAAGPCQRSTRQAASVRCTGR